MPVERTTVSLHADTKRWLENAREKGETYNETIQRLLERRNA
jgi:hypothetical protein